MSQHSSHSTPHDSGAHAESVRRQVRVFRNIAIGLILLTLVTVGISMMDLAVRTRIALCLAVALLQGFLSVTYLMHLSSERKFITWTLVLTVVFFIALVFLPIWTSSDGIVAR